MNAKTVVPSLYAPTNASYPNVPSVDAYVESTGLPVRLVRAGVISWANAASLAVMAVGCR